MIGTIGLIVFVGVQALNVAGLGLDLALDREGWTTITHRVWADDPAGWTIGLTILGLQALGGLGLTAHFYWR